MSMYRKPTLWTTPNRSCSDSASSVWTAIRAGRRSLLVLRRSQKVHSVKTDSSFCDSGAWHVTLIEASFRPGQLAGAVRETLSSLFRSRRLARPGRCALVILPFVFIAQPAGAQDCSISQRMGDWDDIQRFRDCIEQHGLETWSPPGEPRLGHPRQLVVLEGTLASRPTLTGNLTSSDAVWDDRSHYDVWTVTAGTVGKRVVIDMESDDVDAYLRVLREDGTPGATDDDEASGTLTPATFCRAIHS